MYEIFAYSVLTIIAIAMIVMIILDSDNTVKDFVEMVREVRAERKKNTREKKWGYPVGLRREFSNPICEQTTVDDNTSKPNKGTSRHILSNREEKIVWDDEEIDIAISQSSCQKQAINRHRHDNWERANATANNCGRKPRYKDHNKKRGLRAKEALAAWC